ncbi:hypothetical protein SeMB42_g06386 [Synchytrium endobioticum]|uniref:Histone deacetylase complex subunit SAP30 Sin3 binding domain-containing protein n=1 Tax=Synchytrium endobioticum TaxID=286115 RepID=A0A507CL79_9FUNG|nr:hypothetical protein SeMB42_g06386 [Synchytrium endobioticum]
MAPYTIPIPLHPTIDASHALPADPYYHIATTTTAYSSIVKKKKTASSVATIATTTTANNNKRPAAATFSDPSSYYPIPPSTSHHDQHLKMDFSDVDDAILKRYKKQYKIPSPPPSDSRQELQDAVARHFANTIPDEGDSITFFLYTLRNQDNVLKLPGRMLEPAPAAKYETSSHHHTRRW